MSSALAQSEAIRPVSAGMVVSPRFEHLDELRGFAALAVVLFHIGTRVGAPTLVTNGYLAVDFFFMLSGFVIAQNYEGRLACSQGGAGGGVARQPMAWRAFTMRRLVRLMPMAMLGAALGGAYLLSRWMVSPSRSDPLPQLLAANGLNLFVLPKLWLGRSTGQELFPANGPLWSLFLEIVMNLVWAAALVGRRTRTLALVTVLGAVLTVIVALRLGTLDIGWEIRSLDGGFGRVVFGFGVGLLVQRWYVARAVQVGPVTNLPLRRWMTIVVLLATMMVPLQDLRWTLFVEFAIMPPLLVAAVALPDQHAGPIGTMLGRLSYPLYAIHMPLLALFAGMLKYRAMASGAGYLLYLLAVPLLALAWLAAARFDEPIRAALSRRLVVRPRREAAFAAG